jgi:cholesterol transport system auxiliary component
MHHPYRTLHLTTLALCLLALAACSLDQLKPEAQDNSTYVLNASIEPRAASQRNDLLVVVSTPQAQPGFDTRRIAYTKAPFTLDYYTKSAWAETPAQMFGPLIVRSLDGSGSFRAVLAAPAPVAGDLRLDTEIVRLQQEFFQQPSRVRVTLQAKLYNITTREVLATKQLEAVADAPSEDAYGGVQAANTATMSLLSELVAFVQANAPAQR